MFFIRLAIVLFVILKVARGHGLVEQFLVALGTCLILDVIQMLLEWLV